MRVEEKQNVEKHLLKALRRAFKWEGKKRTGWHVSDFVYCLKKPYYKRQPDYEEDLSNDSVLYFVRGRSLHDLLEKMYPDREVRVSIEDIVGSVDAMTQDGTCIEIKTTKRLWKNEANDHHVKQVSYYMAMADSNMGQILYYEMTDNRLRVFEISLTDDDLSDLKSEILVKKDDVIQALETKKVRLLDNTNAAWECKWCPHEEVCKKDMKNVKKEEHTL